MKIASKFAEQQLAFKATIELKPICTIGLTDQDPRYASLVSQINNFNDRLAREQPTEDYEYSIYKQLALVLSNLANTTTSKQQTLTKTETWLKDHQKMVEYEKEVKKLFKEKHLPRQVARYGSKTIVLKEDIKSKGQADELAEELYPFKVGNRTLISELQPATQRIKLYDRKQVLVLDNIKQISKTTKLSRVIYKAEPFRNKPIQAEHDQETPEPWKSEAPAEQIQFVPPPQNNVQGAVVIVPQEIEEIQVEQQEEPIEDKLAPRNRLYNRAQIEREHLITNEATPFRNFKQSNTPAIKRLNSRYVKLINKQYKRKGQEEMDRKQLKNWAREKARAEKELARRCQARLSKSNYLSPKNKQKPLSINKQTDDSVILPQLSTSPERQSLFEFEQSLATTNLIRQKRKALKRIKIQDLQEVQQRIPSQSVVEKRKNRSLGAILDEYSPEKEQIKQQQQVLEIKERLAKKGFIGITLQQLSHGLVVPVVQQNPEAPLPSHELPHNPYFKVPKPKKKKKKKE